jgi:hypothetical protein
VHEGRTPSPCINCKREDVTKRYWLLSQKRDQPLFYTFVKNAYAFKDNDCFLTVSVSEPLRENSKLFSFMALKEILNIGNI